MFTVEITRIEFDFSSLSEIVDNVEMEGLDESLDQELQAEYIGKVYTFDTKDECDEELANKISDEAGFCILSVEYEEV